MGTSELKTALNTIISNTNDKYLLNEIYQSIAKVLSNTKNPSIKLSAAEKKAIDEALNAVKNGEVYSHEKVMVNMKKQYASLHK